MLEPGLERNRNSSIPAIFLLNQELTEFFFSYQLEAENAFYSKKLLGIATTSAHLRQQPRLTFEGKRRFFDFHPGCVIRRWLWFRPERSAVCGARRGSSVWSRLKLGTFRRRGSRRRSLGFRFPRAPRCRRRTPSRTRPTYRRSLVW